MKPTALELYSAIYRALLDAKIALNCDSAYVIDRLQQAEEALNVAYRRLAALENMILLVNPAEELSKETSETQEVSQ